MLRDGDGASFRRDVGGRFLLDLRRTGIDALEGRVRIVGTYVVEELVDVDTIERL